MKPLILAIEPDRRNAPPLRSIARRLGADLVLTDSVDGALTALGAQVPDLLLIPALLSVRDELTLTERLRSLGDAAAHLQTLTIPILEATEPPSHGGVFGALRRDRPHVAGPDACETDTFAEQVGVYLDRAAEARGRHVSPSGPAVIEPVGTAPHDSVRPGDTAASGAGGAPADLTDADLAAFISEEFVDLEPITLVRGPLTVAELPSAPPLVDEAGMLRETLSDFVSEGRPDGRPEQPADDAPPSDTPYDDWRFFDPEEPRFVALLARLDDIATRPA